jgi:hypothetical protein
MPTIHVVGPTMVAPGCARRSAGSNGQLRSVAVIRFQQADGQPGISESPRYLTVHGHGAGQARTVSGSAAVFPWAARLPADRLISLYGDFLVGGGYRQTGCPVSVPVAMQASAGRTTHHGPNGPVWWPCRGRLPRAPCDASAPRRDATRSCCCRGWRAGEQIQGGP